MNFLEDNARDLLRNAQQPGIQDQGIQNQPRTHLSLANIWILLEQLPPPDPLHTTFSQHPFPAAQPQSPSIFQPNKPLGISPCGKELNLCRTVVPPVKAET